MRTLRIVGAAFLILLGAMLIVAWSMAGRTVSAIESGEAASNLTEKLLEDPDFAQAAAARATDQLVEKTDGRFVQRLIIAFQPEIQTAIERVLTSDQVNKLVTGSVSKFEEHLTSELTEPNRPSAPFVVSIDLSDRVNARLDQIPVVGPFIPTVTIPPLEKEVIDAKTFDQVRQVYGALKFVAGWGLLFGLILIVGGYFVAPRTRWYWPQAALGAGFVVFAVSVIVRRAVPAAIASSVPGGKEGGAGTFLSDFVSTNTTGPIATSLALIALWALLLALGFAAIARLLPGWRTQYAERTAATAVADVVVDDAVVVDAVVDDAVVVDAVVVEPAVAESALVEEPHAQVVDTVPLEPVADAPKTKAPAPKRAPAKKPATASGTDKPKTTRARKPAPPTE
jgi:hypothetical protein